MNPRICDAIHLRIVLELRYHAYSRLVEPYVYGVSRFGEELLRCYQVAGGSVGRKARGWKLLKVAEIASIHATQTSFETRTRSYNPQDPGIPQVYCRIE